MTLVEKLVAGDILENDEARKVLDAILGGLSTSWVLWVELAAVYLRQGQYDQVQQILDDLVSREENKV